MAVEPKKKDLLKFFKSDDFTEARIKMCAMFILLSYVNELHEDIDKLLQGYEGIFVGSLKKASKEATKAFEAYDKEYVSRINTKSYKLGDTTASIESKIDSALENNSFYYKQGFDILYNLINESTKLCDDKEDIEKERQPDFELVAPEAVEGAVEDLKKMFRKHPLYQKSTDQERTIEAVVVGFKTAVNWLNKVYLDS